MAKKKTTGRSKPRAKGEGSFRVRNGRVEYRFTYVDENDETIRKSVRGESELECYLKAEEVLKQVERKRRGITDDATLVELLRQKYDNDYAKNYVGEQGYGRNIASLKSLEKSPIGQTPIKDITKDQMEKYLQSLTRYSENVIKKMYRQVVLAYEIAVRKEILSRNLMDSEDLRRPRSSKKTKKVTGLTLEEQKKFLETLEDYREPSGRNEYKDQLLIELYSGMRMGEINALKPEDIDLEKGIVHVKRTVSRGLEYRVFIKEGTKTYTGIRDIPVSSILRPVLEKVLREYEENPNPMGLLFYDEYKNDVIDTNQVNCYFGRVLEKAGVAHRGQHALRHTFATRCIEADVPPLVLKTWLGHRDIHITLDTYADVFENMHNSAIEKVEKYEDMIDRSQRHEEE